MLAHLSPSLRRLAGVALVSVTLGGALVALAACGDGATPAPPTRTLTPSTDPSSGRKHTSESPSPSSGTTASPSPTKTGTTPTPSPTRITDKAIKAGILARMAQEPGLQGFEIRIVVNDGIVYLRGRVRTKQQRTLVEQIALTEAGVKKVVSMIDVDDAAGY